MLLTVRPKGNMIVLEWQMCIPASACRYTSEIIYGLRRFRSLKSREEIKVLSFGCGPCTDLFALDYMKRNREMDYQTVEYRGIDYSEAVWENIHRDIKGIENNECKICFYYADMCDIIDDIYQENWTPDLIVFQYVFSDMHKHTGEEGTRIFIDKFSEYYNMKASENTCIILNDINLGTKYGGGREYFDQLYYRLESSSVKRGRFCNDNSRSSYYPRGYTYGDDSDGELPDNANLFDLSPWQRYSPFNTCASAQMLIQRETGI